MTTEINFDDVRAVYVERRFSRNAGCYVTHLWIKCRGDTDGYRANASVHVRCYGGADDAEPPEVCIVPEE